MAPDRPAAHVPRVAYVLKRYPRLSETFILNEILALERAGVPVRIFAASDPGEPRVHEAVRQVMARVTYTGTRGSGVLGDLLAGHREASRASPAVYDDLLARALAHGAPGNADEFAQAAWIAALVRRESIGHLHAHFATSASRVAFLASRLAGVPFSVTAHAKDLFAHSVDRGALSALLERASFVVAISDYHRRFLLDLSPRARVEIVRNGVDLQRFPWNGGRAALAGAAAPRPSRPPLVLAAGRLVEKKGFDVLLQACALLRDRGVPFACRIIGEGDQRPTLERIVGALDLREAQLDGARTQEELFAVLVEASVLAVPCITAPSGDRDGLPTVILEAMAAGVPVVGTPVTAIPEIVSHGETGLLVPERDPSALADAIEGLLRDPGQSRTLTHAARRLVEQRHDARRSVKRLAGLFAEVARCA